MLTRTERTYTLDDQDELSVSPDEACISLQNLSVTGDDFCINFVPAQLSKLRDLICHLEQLRDRQDAKQSREAVTA